MKKSIIKKAIKTLQGTRGLSDIRTVGQVRKSAMPELPTTSVLHLYMRRTERDRIIKTLENLEKRKAQLQKRLKEVEQEMAKLFERTTDVARELKGECATLSGSEEPSMTGKRVLNY